jgi:hypothetical protein
VQVARSTQAIDWSSIEWRVFADQAATAEGLICLPKDNHLHTDALDKTDQGLQAGKNPLPGVEFKVLSYKNGSR